MNHTAPGIQFASLGRYLLGDLNGSTVHRHLIKSASEQPMDWLRRLR
jgi:hypothetical protein